MRQASVDVGVLQEVVGRVVPGSGVPEVGRTETGGSTLVYRVRRDGVTFYVRFGEDVEDSVLPDALVHERLIGLGVRAPRVVHVEPFDVALGGSFMVTTEIPGESIEAYQGPNLEEILVEAGRDLAAINSLAVDGFSWIRRDPAATDRLVGEWPAMRSFIFEHLEADLARLRGDFFTDEEVETVRRVMTSDDEWLETRQACLVHGDFDASHIYQQDGRYTGIIDFGEMRGADRFYDLGHISIHDGSRRAEPLLPGVMKGYRAVSPLVTEDGYRIARWAVWIGVRRLAIAADRPWAVGYQEHLVGAIRRSLERL